LRSECFSLDDLIDYLEGKKEMLWKMILEYAWIMFHKKRAQDWV